MKEFAASACHGKVSFDSYALAEKALTRNRKTDANKKRCVYKCPTCGKWHIGTRTAPKRMYEKGK